MKVCFTILVVFLAFTATSTSTGVSFDSNEVTLFDHLDDWSLMNILDLLDFADLSSIALLGPRYHQIIVDHYILTKFVLDHAQIYVQTSREITQSAVFRLLGGDLLLPINKITSGYSGMLSSFTFCSIYSRIVIVSEELTARKYIQKIAESVNKYCFNTPQTIKLEINQMDGLDFTFEYATSIRLKGMNKQHKASTLNRCFPRMETLSIYSFARHSLNFNYPYLTHFELDELEYGQFDLKEFGRFNPQIRGFKTEIPWKLENVQQINEIFPKLETLHIELGRERQKKETMLSQLSSFVGGLLRRAPKIDSIHFRHVKNLTIDISDLFHVYGNVMESFEITSDEWTHARLAAMRFDRLETLTFYTRSESFIDEQIDLITQNRDLICVDFSSITLTYEHMRRLVDALPKLKRVTLKCEEAPSVEHILRLMQETRLNEIIAIVSNGIGNTKEQLLQGASTLTEWRYDNYLNGVKKRLTFLRRQA